MHFIGIAQSLGLFVVVCLATAAVLSAAMAALTRIERATVPVALPRPGHASRRSAAPARSAGHVGEVGTRGASRAADRVSSPGSVTYGPGSR